jgi:hypothetical protein
MFSEEDLRDLAQHLKAQADTLEKKDEQANVINLAAPTKPGELPVDVPHQMRKLARQIEVVGYSPLLFGDILEEYEINAGPLDCPLDDTPLHINDDEHLSQVIVKWRLTRGV